MLDILHNVAEPLHRIGPKGVSSGISLRSQPLSCMEEVKKTCRHYVEKCSGKYSNNKAAARYVHQMATDILNQISGVAEEINQFDIQKKLMKNYLSQWNEYFPASIQQYNSPKDIALLLEKLSKENQNLHSIINECESSKKNELEIIHLNMDNQINSAIHAAANERYSLSKTLQTKTIEFETLRKDLEEKYANEINTRDANSSRILMEMERSLKGQIAYEKSEYQKSITAKDSEIFNLRNSIERLKEYHQQELQQLIISHQQDISKLEIRRKDIIRESYAIISLKSKTSKSVTYDGSPKCIQVKVFHKDAAVIEEIDKQCIDLRTTVEILSKHESDNEKKWRLLVEEKNRYKRRADNFEEINNSLREALHNYIP